MNIVFRVDASHDIGIGHLMRCLNLANVLKTIDDVYICFICRHLPESLHELIKKNEHTVIILNHVDAIEQQDELKHSSMLRTSQAQDAKDTIEALSGKSWGWLIVDHYSIDARYESELRSYVDNIMVIDDVADRKHNCDLLLNQNLLSNPLNEYAEKVPKSCRLVLGPEYALLEKGYREEHLKVSFRNGLVNRICVNFGGIDKENVTGKVVAAFLKLKKEDVILDVVLSSNNPHKDLILSAVEGLPNIHIHQNLNSLVSMFVKADIAIGACGVTAWERCCLGLPSLVITIADNQEPGAHVLNCGGFIQWIGKSENTDVDDISSSIQNILNNEIEESWSKKCWELVDGLGALRIASALTAMPDMLLEARPADSSDEALLLKWTNDYVVRNNAFSKAVISEDEHHEWFHDRLNNKKNCLIYIIQNSNAIPVGQVRFDNTEDGWQISYSLDALFRSNSLGHRVLKSGLHELISKVGSCRVFGKVLSKNKASCRIFEKLGFSELEYGNNIIKYFSNFELDSLLH